MRRDDEEIKESYRPRSGCGSCLSKVFLLGLVALGVFAFVYDDLSDAGELPDWLKFDSYRLGKWVEVFRDKSSNGNDGTDSQYDPTLEWNGYSVASRDHQSPNFRPVSGREITGVVLHNTESSSAMSAIYHFKDKSSGVSSHYLIAKDGEVYQMVDERHHAWHCRGANGQSIGIEIVAKGKEEISKEQTRSLIDLLVDIMDRHDLDRWQISGHNFTDGYRGGTSCPNYLFGGNQPRHLEYWLSQKLDPVLQSLKAGEYPLPVVE